MNLEKTSLDFCNRPSHKGLGRNAQRIVSLVELKKLAEQYLAPDSKLRFLLLAEPDLVSAEEAGILTPLFVKLLYRELGGS